MTTAFDPATAYNDDWRWMDFIEDVTWEIPGNPDPTLITGLKGQWQKVSKSDLVSVGSGVGYTNDTAPIVIWQPEPTTGSVPRAFAPQPGHILRRVSRANEGWVILSSNQDALGRWSVDCEREVVNA